MAPFSCDSKLNVYSSPIRIRQSTPAPDPVLRYRRRLQHTAQCHARTSAPIEPPVARRHVRDFGVRLNPGTQGQARRGSRFCKDARRYDFYRTTSLPTKIRPGVTADLFADYACSPGVAVDCYQDGYKWKFSSRCARASSAGMSLNFSGEEDRRRLYQCAEWFQTELNCRARHLRLSIIFPRNRLCQQATLVERNRNRTTELGPSCFSWLADGRQIPCLGNRPPGDQRALHDQVALVGAIKEEKRRILSTSRPSTLSATLSAADHRDCPPFAQELATETSTHEKRPYPLNSRRGSQLHPRSQGQDYNGDSLASLFRWLGPGLLPRALVRSDCLLVVIRCGLIFCSSDSHSPRASANGQTTSHKSGLLQTARSGAWRRPSDSPARSRRSHNQNMFRPCLLVDGVFTLIHVPALSRAR